MTLESQGSLAGFFETLPAIREQAGTFDPAAYRAAPDAWFLAAADVENSTGAIERGQYRAVNFVAAAVIAALKNACRPEAVPFLFAGDGAAVLVPPERALEARVALARVRAFSRREYGLSLRVGLAAVASIRRCGADVRVGRYEPTPGNSFGVFLGGGVALLEASLKGRGDAALAAEAVIPSTLEDGEMPDMTGLSCRWDELRSARGQMVSLIISGASDPAGIHRLLLDMAGRGGDARPVRLDNLVPRWPPKGLMVEARAQRRRGPLVLTLAAVLVKSLAAKAALSWNGPIGSFDPKTYKASITTNTDFSKCDEVLSLVLDCDDTAIAAIRSELEARAAKGELRYGMHLSPTALMTCLVTSLADHQHVHFVDGGNGGYARAAQGLKALSAGAAA